MRGRRALLLIEVVDRYIRTRHPVSSQELVREYRHRFSSATVRNELLALERERYLYKPHPSSGRIPTRSGLRFFAEWLLALADLGERPTRLPAEPQEPASPQLPVLLRRTALLLAAMTGQLGFALAPPRERLRLLDFAMRRVGPSTVLTVTLSELGMVESRVLLLDVDLGPEELAEAEALLLEQLKGRALADLAGQDRPAEGWHSRARLCALGILRQLAEQEPERSLYVEGWPQFLAELSVGSSDWALGQVRALLRFLDDERAFAAALSELRRGQEGLTVHVGDASIPELSEFSVVSAPYLAGGGVLGVIGPLWMDYARAFSATRYVAGRLGGLLARERPETGVKA
ncbi:MAG: hypothetical protein NUV94_05675 [Candidatus Acetothermia bacterium]|nr:hypothetical protein [Candidatus Acetothermia bacterium]